MFADNNGISSESKEQEERLERWRYKSKGIKVSRSKKKQKTYVCECSGVNSWSHPSKQQEVYKRGEEESSGGSGRYRIGHQYIRA